MVTFDQDYTLAVKPGKWSNLPERRRGWRVHIAMDQHELFADGRE
jgi:hypothetical protein